MILPMSNNVAAQQRIVLALAVAPESGPKVAARDRIPGLGAPRSIGACSVDDRSCSARPRSIRRLMWARRICRPALETHQAQAGSDRCQLRGRADPSRTVASAETRSGSSGQSPKLFREVPPRTHRRSRRPASCCERIDAAGFRAEPFDAIRPSSRAATSPASRASAATALFAHEEQSPMGTMAWLAPLLSSFIDRGAPS